jgi:hypothetical protein
LPGFGVTIAVSIYNEENVVQSDAWSSRKKRKNKERTGVIRGEKITFRKSEIAPLDQMPSSQVEDSILVHCPPPRRRSHAGHALKITLVFLAFVMLVVGAVVGTVESGIFDEPLSRKAEIALEGAIGPRYQARVGSTVVRFTSGLRLALVARNVNLLDTATGKHMASADTVRLVLDPLALVEGRIALSSVEAKAMALDTALLPSGDPIDPAQLRVDDIPRGIEALFEQLDFFQHIVERGGTETMEISGLAVKLARQTDNPPVSVVVDKLAFSRPDPNSLRLTGQVSLDGAAATLDAVARLESGQPAELTAILRHLDLKPLTLSRTPQGQPREGIDSFANVSVHAARSAGGAAPDFKASIDVGQGWLVMDRDNQELTGANINLAYNAGQRTLEISKSEARFQATTIPFSGVLIDLDRLDPEVGKGFGIDFLISGGTAAPVASGEAPLGFDGQAFGRYLAASKELQLDSIAVSSPLGTLFGSLHMRMGRGSPEISFGAHADKLETTAIKQLWPYWMGQKARLWAQSNLFGGTVTNGTISVFIPQGRLAEAASSGNLRLGENELHIAFDIDDTRMNVPGEIPPIHSLTGHFDLAGPVLKVAVTRGTSSFPSGRSVNLGPSMFSIPSTSNKPLMARMKLSIAGAADAVGELLTFKPLRVLQRTQFKPEDFGGKISADVEATFGLINDQNPPPPVWKASLDLQKVDLLKSFGSRKIADVDGSIEADPRRVHLVADALIDGIPAKVDMIEPVDPGSDVKRERVITATLGDQQRDKLMPGISDLIAGPIGMELRRIDNDRQGVKIDLTKATLTVPGVGWSKGSGIPATAEFEASGPPDQTSLKDFVLRGDSFGASGDITLSKGGLSQANFSRVQLSPADDFGLTIKRGKGGLDINVNGNAADMRPILARLKSQGNGAAGGRTLDATIRAKIDRVSGFNDESLVNFTMNLSVDNGRLMSANVSGVTRSGQAVVGELSKSGPGGAIRLTGGDAGAVARFADIYRHMKGGLLNLSLRGGDDEIWEGSIDIRRFAIVNEKKLQSIVSTPTGRGGESLNSAVKRDIDASSQNFQRGFAHLVVRHGTVTVENGVVRGDQVGATFQGTIKDASGNIDMTGTFMPAYGLNRLFAEVPIVGFLLGNGTDRGLIGITFKLSGEFDSPSLTINPLSIIAPGVFRQIFEFQ